MPFTSGSGLARDLNTRSWCSPLSLRTPQIMCRRVSSLLVFVTLLGTAGCPGDPPAAEVEELSRRQKDSIIAELPLPGAGAVGAALDAVDATQARKLAHDSIS